MEKIRPTYPSGKLTKRQQWWALHTSRFRREFGTEMQSAQWTHVEQTEQLESTSTVSDSRNESENYPHTPTTSGAITKWTIVKTKYTIISIGAIRQIDFS